MDNDRSEPAKTAVAGQLERGVRPRAWIGPSGQTMPDEIYVAWATSYPADAKHFAPLYDQAALDAGVAAERERCVRIVEAYPVPVGNSAAGEMAAERTMDALREIRDAIRGA